MFLTDSSVAMLNDVLQYVTDHPDEWDQAHYGNRDECGTAGCVAGHMLIRHGEPLGYTPLWQHITGEDFAPAELRHLTNTTYLRAVQPPAGPEIEPSHAVVRMLGLELYTAGAQMCDWLFRSGNTLQNLWHYGQMLADGRLALPADMEPCSAGYEYPAG